MSGAQTLGDLNNIFNLWQIIFNFFLNPNDVQKIICI